MLRLIAPALILTLAAGCATGRAVRHADSAASRGDWDEAVAYYREAVGRDPRRVEVKIRLQRAIQAAAAAHIKRARDLEAQDQLSGAMAEYRLAADLDPTASLATTKANDIERRLRSAAEANRPPARIDVLRQQAQQTSPIPRLDPRAKVEMHYQNIAVRDLLRTITAVTGLNITYDPSADSALSKPYSLDLPDTPVEEVLLQIMQAFTLTYKVVNPKTILVYADTIPNRQRFEEQYLQTFYLSNALPEELQTQLQLLFGTSNLASRPLFTQNKTANTLTVRATAPVLEVIESFVKANDKPVPEVFIQGEILEVDRSFVRQLGLDLSQWALGFTLSPEVVPPNTGGTFPPATPPPFSLNSLKPGPGAGDIFLTSPTALIKLLESNSNTKVLARPETRGRAGTQIQLRLGDNVPIPQTVFNSSAAGGIANVPTTQVAYQAVGVNLLFTPRVTYQDEIVLEALTLEKSGLGAFLDVGGQSFPTIVSRTAQTALGLRDGESTLIAGLLRDDDRKTIRSLPGLSKLPVLNTIFGNSDRQVDQTEIVMIITAHIVRGHDISAADLRPRFVGTGTNIGTGMPQLISPEALSSVTVAPPPGGLASAGAPSGVVQSPATPGDAGTPSAATPARSPGVVAIQAVGGDASAPAAARTGGRVSITAPAVGPDGAVPAGGGPYTMPIQIADVSNVATVSLTITYNPAVMTSPQVGQGSFMMQGGISPTFVPAVNAAAGRIDMAFSRPPSQAGASGTGVLGAISFMSGMPGTSDVTISGVATTTTGQTIPLQFTPARVVVR
ncbi:MAG: cohesin domain-containing protein [Vicinamibacterales bacterium]